MLFIHQNLVCGGKFRIISLYLQPLRSIMPIRGENNDQRHDRGLTEDFCNIIGAVIFLFIVHMDLLHIFGPFLMEIILKLPFFLHKRKRSVICVDEHLVPHNVMPPLSEIMHEIVHFLTIGGVFLNSVRVCLTMIGR